MGSLPCFNLQSLVSPLYVSHGSISVVLFAFDLFLHICDNTDMACVSNGDAFKCGDIWFKYILFITKMYIHWDWV